MGPYFKRTAIWILALAAASIVPFGFAQRPANKSASVTDILFVPLQQWKKAVVDGDTAALQALYSENPAPEVFAPTGRTSVDSEVAFWTGLKARKMKLDISHSEASQNGLQEIVFEAEINSANPSEKRAVYVTEGQIWQQEARGWRLVAAKRSAPAHLQQPTSLDKQIYWPAGDARVEIQQGLERAAASHKRVLVVFGANWCYDCHVLDLAFHRSDIASVLARDYEVVHIDIGQRDKNQDLMKQYGVPMARGIPAIAVLEANGKLVFSQKSGEFANARALAPDDLLGFLNKWKPQER